MSVIFELYNPEGKLLLSSHTKPQGFHYRFSHDTANRSLGDNYVQKFYTLMRAEPYGSSYVYDTYRETFGGLSNDAIASYPFFKPDVKHDADGDGHNHHMGKGGNLLWVCVPNGIYRTAGNKDGYGYSGPRVQGGPSPTGSMIVTGSQPNIKEGYLTQYTLDGEVKWTITAYFRHPHVHYIWQKPKGSPTYDDLYEGNRNVLDFWYDDRSRWSQLGAAYHKRYVSPNGLPLYACMTTGITMNKCGPIFAWNADGTVLDVAYEGERVFSSNYGGLTNIVVNVPIVTFPSVTQDYY